MRFVVAATSFLMACSKAGVVLAPSGDSMVADGIRFTASTAVLESFPVQLHTTVTVTNQTSGRHSVTFRDGCIVLLRAYNTATATAATWDAGRQTACTMALVTVPLEAGASKAFTTVVSARDILGDSLPNGSYHIKAYLRPLSANVELSTGPVPLAVPAK